MKILVTGGAGFIGSAMVRHVVSATKDAVVNVDKLTYAGNLEFLVAIADCERYAFELVDICDREALHHVFTEHQPDAVMHLAAESHVDRSISGPAAFIETNIVGIYVLWEAARNYWNGLETDRKAVFRFHHISTDEVYGDLAHPDEQAASKASSDNLVRAWRRTKRPANFKQDCQKIEQALGIQSSDWQGALSNLNNYLWQHSSSGSTAEYSSLTTQH